MPTAPSNLQVKGAEPGGATRGAYFLATGLALECVVFAGDFALWALDVLAEDLADGLA
jgi:hypothetical protein